LVSGLSSHLFQRVASFLPKNNSTPNRGCCREVLISFREWLHSYYAIGDDDVYTTKLDLFSSLSESGFIPTWK